jgi:hypothetical protein
MAHCFELASAFTKQDEWWDWLPPEQHYSNSSVTFLVKLHEKIDRNEARFKAANAQRTINAKLVNETTPARMAKVYEDQKRMLARNGRRIYRSALQWMDTDAEVAFHRENEEQDEIPFSW